MTLEPWDKYVDFYLDNLEVARLHVTNSFQTLRTYRTDYRLIYRCHNPPPVLPLYYLARELQTNMIVLDAAGRNLVYLPHQASYEVAEQFLRTLWVKYCEEARSKGRTVDGGLPDVLLKVTEFQAGPGDADSARDWIKQEAARFPGYRYLGALQWYIEVMSTGYIPLVETPARGTTDYYFVQCGIDYYPRDESGTGSKTFDRAGAPIGGPSTWELLRFGLTGGFEIEQFVPFWYIRFPPWHVTESVHIRMRMPPGLEVKGEPRTDFDGALKETHFLRTLQASQAEVYAYLGAFEVNKILDAIEGEAVRRDNEIPTYVDSLGMKSVTFTSPYRRKPRHGPTGISTGRSATRTGTKEYPDLCVVTKAGLSKTMGVLLALFWAIVAFEYVARFAGALLTNDFLVLLTGLLVVVVATSIATIDKPVLRIPVSLHTVLAVIAFFACLAV
jgi:hypothetical protein